MGVLGIVFDKSRKKVLLVKRRDVPAWVLPGGGVETGENLKRAVCREVEEETGYEVSVIRKVAEYDYKNKREKAHLFECKIVSGKPTLNPEAKAIAFFSTKALPEVRHPNIDIWVEDSLINNKGVIKKTLKTVNPLGVVKYLFRHPVPVFRYWLVKMGLRINT